MSSHHCHQRCRHHHHDYQRRHHHHHQNVNIYSKVVYTLLDEDGDENLSTKEFNPVSSSSSSSLLSISPSENTAIDTNIIYHIFIKYHKSYINIIYQVLFSWRHSRGFQNGALSVTLGNMKFWTELNTIKFWTFWQHQILNFFWQHQILNFLATWSSEKSSSSSLIILSVALSHKKLDPNCNSEHWVIESWTTQFRFFVIFEGAGNLYLDPLLPKKLCIFKAHFTVDILLFIYYLFHIFSMVQINFWQSWLFPGSWFI